MDMDDELFEFVKSHKMDKGELLEVVKLIKETSTEESFEVQNEKSENLNPENCKVIDNADVKSSWWFDTFEDRIFTFSILSSILLYLFFLCSGQSEILHIEYV